MAGELTLRVITPDRIVLDATASSVRIPGVDGSMGILPRHAPMVAALGTGLLTFRSGGVDVVAFVAGGFADVHDDTVRVVTEAGEKAGDIDEGRAREAEERARRRIEEGREPGGVKQVDVIRAEASLRRAMMRLRARQRAGL